MPELRKISWAEFQRNCRVNPNPYSYTHSKRRFYNARSGDKALIIRKYGGIGDVLKCSYLLSVLHNVYPAVSLTFCVPGAYHELFEDVPWLTLVDYDKLSMPDDKVRGGVIDALYASQFDIVEDASTPCHCHEQLIALWDFDNGPIKWQNRLNIWLSAISPLREKDIVNPRSCIKIDKMEVAAARYKYGLDRGRKHALVAPISCLGVKNFPWHRELCALLHSLGFSAHMLGPMGGGIEADTLRDFLAILGAASLVITVDSAALHGCGIMETRALGLFNMNDGETYCKYYPAVKPVQLCQTPCIANNWDICKRKTNGAWNCYPENSIEIIRKELTGGGYV